jgi:hypothetical protein
VTPRDHESYREDVAAYVLEALSDSERRELERHLDECADCREEVERLRPAAEALPRSVEPLAPPPELKASLMRVVTEEAREQEPASRRPRLRVPWRMNVLRPALAVLLLVVGLAAGFGLARGVGDDDARTISAAADRAEAPRAHGVLVVPGDGEDGAVLRVGGLPALRSGVYQAWVQHGEEMLPQPTFDVGENGVGAVALPADLSDADAVLVTREPRGGSRVPSEPAILSARL